MEPEVVDELDPGIRDIVLILNNLGYKTSDSGDGSKYPEMACALPYRNVVVQLPVDHTYEQMGKATDDIQKLLGDGWEVYLTYSPNETSARGLIVCAEKSEALKEHNDKLSHG